MAGQQEIKRAAQAVDVGPQIDLVAVDGLLGRKIVGRAEHVFVVGDGQRGLLVVREQGQAQVENLHHPLLIDQQVGGLHVAVNQAGIVGVLEALGGLGDVVAGHSQRQRPIVLDDVLQVWPSMNSITM